MGEGGETVEAAAGVGRVDKEGEPASVAVRVGRVGEDGEADEAVRVGGFWQQRLCGG